jgi:hypothetical protein
MTYLNKVVHQSDVSQRASRHATCILSLFDRVHGDSVGNGLHETGIITRNQNAEAVKAS